MTGFPALLPKNSKYKMPWEANVVRDGPYCAPGRTSKIFRFNGDGFNLVVGGSTLLWLMSCFLAPEPTVSSRSAAEADAASCGCGCKERAD